MLGILIMHSKVGPCLGFCFVVVVVGFVWFFCLWMSGFFFYSVVDFFVCLFVLGFFVVLGFFLFFLKIFGGS